MECAGSSQREPVSWWLTSFLAAKRWKNSMKRFVIDPANGAKVYALDARRRESCPCRGMGFRHRRREFASSCRRVAHAPAGRDLEQIARGGAGAEIQRSKHSHPPHLDRDLENTAWSEDQERARHWPTQTTHRGFAQGDHGRDGVAGPHRARFHECPTISNGRLSSPILQTSRGARLPPLTNPMNILPFRLNVPAEVILERPEGTLVQGRYGDRVMFSLADGRVMYVPPFVSQ